MAEFVGKDKVLFACEGRENANIQMVAGVKDQSGFGLIQLPQQVLKVCIRHGIAGHQS